MVGRQWLLLLLFIGMGLPSFGATVAEEQALWALWAAATNIPAQHEAGARACQQFQQTFPTNQLLSASQGLAAWHYLRLGKTNEALALLNAAASAAGTPVAQAGIEMSRRWLTRLDREKVRSALADYYRHNLEYPVNLQPLKKTSPNSAVPLTDRWGAPWQYELTAFKVIKGARGQRYRLESKQLRESSDLAQALAEPYAGRIQLQNLSISTMGSGVRNVAFQLLGDKPEKVLLSEGGQAAGITLAYLGAQIIIFSDGDHWLVLPRPVK
ncbi:MAG: hypothetical protein HYV35_09410 [Lentisphaerae bacterium]|nr:hypothetical protein [Lentisphaerota bacterium]